jgi:hypothetical protein
MGVDAATSSVAVAAGRRSTAALGRFVRHLAAFAALPGLLLLFGEAVLQESGEIWPLGRVLAFERAHPDSLYLRGTDQVFYAFKYRGIVERRPSALVLGSSRVMKFRAPMFGGQAAGFYNAGGMVNSLSDASAFVSRLRPATAPRVVLLGIDLWWLNAGVAPTFNFDAEVDKDAGLRFDDHLLALRWLVRHPASLAHELRAVNDPASRNAIGIAAREKHGGFRPDGSFKAIVPTPRTAEEWAFVDREVPPIIERVRTATANFPPADRVSPERLAALDDVLGRFQAAHTMVVGYLPPFSSEVAAALASDPRHRGLYFDFRRTMPQVFQKHGFPLFDASQTTSVGMDDRAMSDGFHAEETFQVRVLKALIDDPRVAPLLPGARAALDRALASPNTNYWQADFGS